MPRKLNPGRVVGIIRVSTKGQDLGADAQRTHLTAWCEREGLDLIEVFEDRMSGAKPFEARTELQSALQTCVSQNAGLLVSMNWSRFSRDKYFFAKLELECEGLGIRPVTVEGGLEETEVLRDIKQALVSDELRKIRERNQRRAQECIRQGRTHGGSLPYGMRRKEGGKTGTRGTVVELEPCPQEQAILEEIQLRRKELSLRKLAEFLNSAGLLSRPSKNHPEGTSWTASKLHKLLKRIDTEG